MTSSALNFLQTLLIQLVQAHLRGADN